MVWGLPILAACDAGKAVYCAAPLDFPTEVALAIQQRLEHSGVAFVAEFPQRHAAATLRLKELIATRLGSPRLVFCHQRIPAEATGTRPQNEPPVLPMHEMVRACRLVPLCRRSPADFGAGPVARGPEGAETSTTR